MPSLPRKEVIKACLGVTVALRVVRSHVPISIIECAVPEVMALVMHFNAKRDGTAPTESFNVETHAVCQGRRYRTVKWPTSQQQKGASELWKDADEGKE